MKPKADKLHQCAICQTPFKRRNTLHKVCSVQCALKLTEQGKAKRRRQAEREQRKADKIRLDKMKSTGDLMKEAQTAFNAFIRERDKGKACISCNTPLNGAPNSYDAGHYRSRGAAGHLRFDEDNVHGQCKQCNRYLSGNVVEYRRGLLAKIGQWRVEKLENNNQTRTFSKDELREIKRAYQKKLKELKAKR